MPDLTRHRLLHLLAASGALALPARASAQAPPLRIATAIGDSFSSPYYVQDGGFLAKAGLNAEIGLFTNGGTVMQSVVGGTNDIGLADATQLANAAARGVPVAFFAGGGLYRSEAPTSALCVPKSTTIKKPKDLEGQTVAVIALKSATEIAMRRWMQANNVDQSQVKLFEMPVVDIPGALVRGTVAAGVVAEPVLSQAALGGDVVIFAKPFDAISKRFLLSGYFANRDWLAANGPTEAKLVAAIYDAARWANAHPDLTAPILSKNEKFEVDKVRAMSRVTMATSLDAAAFQPVLDAAADLKLIPAPVDATKLIIRIDK